MTNHSLKYHRPLMDFIEFFEKVRVRSLPLIEKIIEPSIRFHDPFHDEIGEEGIVSVWEKRLERIESFKFKVRDYSWSKDEEGVAYIQWLMSGRRDGTPWQVSGMSEITFSTEKRVASCTEFWAQSENMYEPPKAIKSFFNRLRRSA